MSVAVEIGTPESFDELIGGGPELVVAYFWAPDCPHCEVFARDLPGLLEGLPPVGVRLVKVNASEHPDLARRFALVGVPAFVLFQGGRKLGILRQYPGREDWRTVITEQAAAAAH